MMSCELTSLILIYLFLMVVARVSPNSIIGVLIRLMERLLALLTFPGVILNVLGRKLFCAIAGVPVLEAKYLSLGDPIGYVLHGKVDRYRDAYLITIGPFLVNTVFAMAMFILPCFGLPFIVDIPFLWLGASFAAQAIPGDGESQGLWRWTKRRYEQTPVVLMGSPLPMILASIRRFKGFLRVGFIYACVLYCVTFCLVAIVVIAGSLALPGAYSAKIASADFASPPAAPGANSDFKDNGANPSYPSSAILPGKTAGYPGLDDTGVAGKEAGAKDWLPIAQDAMKAKNAKAVLISVDGHSSDDGVSLPINGKSHRWEYTFASQADDLLYHVTVHDGALSGIDKGSLGSSGTEKILYKYGDPTIGSWNLDSTDAVNISNSEFKELTGTEAPASAAYCLELSCWNRLTWTVYNYDTRSGVIADICVDQETGQVSHTWMPSGQSG